MASVLVNVSRFGRFSHENVRLSKLTSCDPTALSRLVAARTASSKSLPIPNFWLVEVMDLVFECFLQHEKVSPIEAPIKFLLTKVKIELLS